MKTQDPSGNEAELKTKTEEDFLRIGGVLLTTLAESTAGADPVKLRQEVGFLTGASPEFVKATAAMLQEMGMVRICYARGNDGAVLTQFGQAVQPTFEHFLEEDFQHGETA